MTTHAIFLALTTIVASPVDATESDKCPISGKKGDPECTLFSEGKNHVFCCGNCRAKFAKERENRLSEKEQKGNWQLAFNGKDLKSFQKPTRTGKWEVRKGVLTGFGGPGVLATKRSYDHFELTADVRVHDTVGKKRGNSGFFIRSTGLLAMRGRWPDGPEIQVDHGDPNFWTGAIWKTAKAKKVKTKDKEWFRMRIEALGKRVRVWVNEELVTEHELEGEVVKGPVALQVHHPTDLVEFKNFKIRPIALKAKKKS